MQYCSLQHWTLLLSQVTFTCDTIHWVLFLLWLHPFHLSGVISPLISSSILVTYWPGEFLFHYPIILPFHTAHGVSRQEYWSGLPYPSPVDHVLSDLSTMPACLGWPHRAWLCFIELDKAMVLVWLDWLVFCEYRFITRWSTPKSDWLYSLQPKMEKLYTVSKKKTRSWLWLRPWTAYCQIQT